MNDYEYEKVEGMTLGQIVDEMLDGKVFYFVQMGNYVKATRHSCMASMETCYTRKENPWHSKCEGGLIMVETAYGWDCRTLIKYDQSNLPRPFECKDGFYMNARPLTTEERDAIKAVDQGSYRAL